MPLARHGRRSTRAGGALAHGTSSFLSIATGHVPDRYVATRTHTPRPAFCRSHPSPPAHPRGAQSVCRGTPMTTGRPHRLVEERDLAERIAELVRQPMPATHAAAECGVPPRTYFRWMAEGEADDAPDHLRQFWQELSRAKREAASTLREAIQKRAVGFETLRTDRHGNEYREWDSDWRAAAWLLERMAPDEYGNRMRLDIADVEVDEDEVFDEATEAAAREFIAKATGHDAVA